MKIDASPEEVARAIFANATPPDPSRASTTSRRNRKELAEAPPEGILEIGLASGRKPHGPVLQV